jgi:hypothetical protein
VDKPVLLRTSADRHKGMILLQRLEAALLVNFKITPKTDI